MISYKLSMISKALILGASARMVPEILKQGVAAANRIYLPDEAEGWCEHEAI